MRTTTILLPVLVMLLFTCTIDAKEKSKKTTPIQITTNDYQDLVILFKEWRRFEAPPMHEGAPDYRKATFTERMPTFNQLRARHAAIDTTGWSIPNKVDWMVVWAEMNGFDFNQRVLKPWERDPAFYKTIWTAKSDVPAHEGPTHHGTLELWTYTFPLSDAARTKMLKELAVIPSLNAQAKTNLTGNARDLWVTGIRDIKTQSEVLENMKSAAGVRADEALMAAIEKAQTATNQLVAWLEAQSDKKTGPSGIGKENYTWYMQNVHLVPLTWEDEVMILKRELARAWSALKLEEHRNRKLPQLIAADSPKSYDALANRAANSFLNFLESEAILTVKDYFEPALREHLGTFVPEETRNFFYITSHYDPRPLFSHFYHWFELARMENEPNPSEIRKGPLLYNIFDSRNEGTATAVEEMFMDAGLYDDDPRVREIVYIMIAQRAARGLGSLYAHANEMTMEEAGSIHSEYTPRGWMKTEKELLIFEQHLYLRQPGYGTSYITGKYLLEAAMAAYARDKELEGAPFVLSDFFDSINSIGNIPVALTQWEMTGNADHMVMMK
ncbi:hypothetical protein [Flavobacterium sp. ASW18X]|uniref:hypothetical protein n=1 Tax=Flavobacterium sp. ASW18X TaxID=2572595 RepID=UPI0010AE051E|nr:hypothetical protein [Flavobacterium sp. ASW18X]TKD67234.1 hypothetical protein FBT53_00045 [Flavobacterium sp. ASW18X]